MNVLLQSIENSILSRRLLRTGQQMLVAISGGLDSMVLLDALQRLSSRHRWKLTIAHFNHRLRGAASDADERLVRSVAARHRIPIVCGAWPRAEHVAAKQFGLEMAARVARHRFLAEQAHAHKARSIAIAHHADDQVELFFLRLLRGSGGEALAGMKWKNPSPADGRLMLIRPLLDLQKSQLSVYAKDQQLRFREDASNQDQRHDRNWLRISLLPMLARRSGPGWLQSILRTMELAGAEADFARTTAEAWQPGKEPFAALHPSVQRHWIRRELQRLGATSSFDLVEQLRGTTGRPITAAPGIALRRDAVGRIERCANIEPEIFREAAIEIDLNLADQRQAAFGNLAFDWARRRREGTVRHPASRAGREWFDADRVGTKIQLRHWRPGDRFQPIGMQHSVKLQDLFTNMKIPRARRRGLVVAETARGEIFWVEGVRISEKFKISARTRVTLDWRWRRDPASYHKTRSDRGGKG